MAFLFEEIKSIVKFGVKKDIPEFIQDGLSEAINLRDYQREALEHFIIYDESDLSKNKQIWTLFHMATGSGKTVMMAALVLYYYKKGYRNFLFFVRNINIIDKTIENLTKTESKKYLFKSPLEIEGNKVNINKVNNFQGVDSNAINICFTSNAGLQNALGVVPQENALSINDFEDNKVVLIADESHHLNAITKNGVFVFDEQDDNSWENTTTKAFRANKDNVLLEFTATCDLKNDYVKNKYKDVIVYNYPLSSFREDKYSKEIMSLPSTDDMMERVFISLILSEYRYKLFLENNYDIKPIVMLKSKTIKDSKLFYEEFLRFLKNDFDSEYLNEIKNRTTATKLIQDAFDYFNKNNISMENLSQEIKLHFAEEHCIPLNSSRGKITKDEADLLNSLEDPNNPYRLIFVVDMLNEGWDVLNLFDIVRLYNERQGAHGKKEKVSKYTISEAQLIGRGARYFPFKTNDYQVANKRKYDQDLDNPLRICETLVYHCTTNSKYITEIRTALREIGLMNQREQKHIKLKLKNTFKSEQFYKTGVYFANEKVEKSRKDVNGIPNRLKYLAVEHRVVSKSGEAIELFGHDRVKSEKTETITYKVRDIPLNVKRKSIRCFSQLSFNKLIEKFPNLKSIDEFLNSDKYLGDVLINYTFSEGWKIENNDLLNGLSKLLKEVSKHITKIKKEYYGTEEFKEKYIKTTFKDVDRFMETSSISNGGEGISQNDDSVDPNLRLDLSSAEWYVYNDNFGTTEEKKFVKYFSNLIKDFQSKFAEVYLLRNEQQVGIYDFDTGERFEPDYLLFLSNKYKESKLYYQIFIEPKGDHLLDKDAWKEKFLLTLKNKNIEYQLFANDDKYKIWGLPFYNENNNISAFDKAVKDILKD